MSSQIEGQGYHLDDTLTGRSQDNPFVALDMFPWQHVLTSLVSDLLSVHASHGELFLSIQTCLSLALHVYGVVGCHEYLPGQRMLWFVQKFWVLPTVLQQPHSQHLASAIKE